MRTLSGILTVFLVLALTACPSLEPSPDRLTLDPAPFSRLPGWDKDTLWPAIPAFLRSCATFKARKDTAPFYRNQRPAAEDSVFFGFVADWRPPCEAAEKIARGDNEAARKFFEHWFQPYLAANNEEEAGLFTGYYEAELHGSRQASERYRVPLYRRPNDLVTIDLGLFRDDLRGRRLAGRVRDRRLVPFEVRAEINGGALKGKNLVLLWVDDPVDAFFLHVQGSGRVILDDGSAVRVGYDGQNGHSYVSIGRKLVDYGEMELNQVSMQSIRSWLKAHPERAEKLLETNPSFIFFRAVPVQDPEAGPPGAQGTPLTPGRSIAVDHAFIALGVPLWLDTTEPAQKPATEMADDPAPARVFPSLQRLMVSQDTGGAIRGPVRGDFFWGFGEDAEEKAGRMKQSGHYYLLLPKTVRPNLAGVKDPQGGKS
jgi:membrane-bound lytic murein transglycosylase A